LPRARGQTVAEGAPLFVLESESEAALRREAEQRVRQADARLANLEKGRRPDEDADALAAATARLRADPRWRWSPSEPGLEDVFIQLMGSARDLVR